MKIVLLEGVSYAKEQGIRIVVKTPLMEYNKYCYRELYRFCKDNGFKYMASLIIFSKNNGDSTVKRLSVNYKDMVIIAKEIEKFEPIGKRKDYEETCGSLKYTLAIDSFGDVFPCNSFYYKVGNIKDESLSKIWENRKLKEIQNIKKEDLIECASCYYKSKCSRCPGLAWNEDGSYLGCSSSAMLDAKLRL